MSSHFHHHSLSNSNNKSNNKSNNSHSRCYQYTRASALVAHIIMVMALLASVSALADNTNISVKEANTLSQAGKVTLIDIRAESEWLETGVAPQAVTLSMHQQGGIPAFTQSLTTLLNGDKNQPIALICAGGVRSTRLQQYLIDNGFTQVSNVTEGMVGGLFTKGWIDHDLPLEGYEK